MITIGNPIFDSVFKFFLADDVSAKILLSALLKTTVTKLETRKNEFMQKGENAELSVMRIDFGAHILEKDIDGNEHERLIIIELQKAWVNYEVPRFRRYLGHNYIASENIFHDEKDDRDYGLPIVAVYILNHRVGKLTEPVTYLNRKYLDYYDNELTNGVPDKFAESLSHNCIIVQVPLLPGKIRNRAEKILQIFNQKFTVGKKGFKMEFDEQLVDGDTEMQKLVNRLSMVFADEHTTEMMIVENEEYQEHLEFLANRAALKKSTEELQELAKAIDEHVKIIDEQGKTIDEQGKRIDEQGKTIDEQGKTIDEQGKRIDEQGKTIDEQGKTIDEQEKTIDEQGKTIDEQGKTIDEQGKTIDEQEKALEEKDKTIKVQTKALEDKDKTIENQNKALEDKDKELEKLRLLLQQHGLSNN